jgi:hypothetical protein
MSMEVCMLSWLRGGGAWASKASPPPCIRPGVIKLSGASWSEPHSELFNPCLCMHPVFFGYVSTQRWLHANFATCSHWRKVYHAAFLSSVNDCITFTALVKNLFHQIFLQYKGTCSWAWWNFCLVKIITSIIIWYQGLIDPWQYAAKVL